MFQSYLTCQPIVHQGYEKTASRENSSRKACIITTLDNVMLHILIVLSSKDKPHLDKGQILSLHKLQLNHGFLVIAQ
jgi:hypothetical protein